MMQPPPTPEGSWRFSVPITEVRPHERAAVGFVNSRSSIAFDRLRISLCVLFQSSFKQIDGSRPTRETFLKILARVDGILIRATHHTAMESSSLSDISMDTAVPHNTGQEVASTVEDCSCPPGYVGLSCEVGWQPGGFAFESRFQ